MAGADAEREFWNTWNASTREQGLDRVPLEQQARVLAWIAGLGRTDLEILEVGCGAGWLVPALLPFGRVTATDLSDEVLARAGERWPAARFVAGDFMVLDFPEGAYDVVVTLEVLSHVPDQQAFVDKLRRLLKPGGVLLLATQNRPALERNTIPPPGPGQRRQWVDRHELTRLLTPGFVVKDLVSITPRFNRGPLHVVNAERVRQLVTRAGLARPYGWLVTAQERRWLGWTLIVRAERPR